MLPLHRVNLLIILAWLKIKVCFHGMRVITQGNQSLVGLIKELVSLIPWSYTNWKCLTLLLTYSIGWRLTISDYNKSENKSTKYQQWFIILNHHLGGQTNTWLWCVIPPMRALCSRVSWWDRVRFSTVCSMCRLIGTTITNINCLWGRFSDICTWLWLLSFTVWFFL